MKVTEPALKPTAFPAGLREDNPDQYAKLLKLLGGANNGGARLWRDAGRNNF
ncbi:MAG: SusD/RagB family nutrient-binding outer membrane lipoprotein [Mediterranea sp.]|nr:SusD/RagB family nutrient-binding outer membrane lipoprotein [Mediterranea sp.]